MHKLSSEIESISMRLCHTKTIKKIANQKFICIRKNHAAVALASVCQTEGLVRNKIRTYLDDRMQTILSILEIRTSVANYLKTSPKICAILYLSTEIS